jgi:hypothetical protein
MPETLTSEQQAEEQAIRGTLAGDDAAAITAYLRTVHISDLAAIAGRGEAHIHGPGDRYIDVTGAVSATARDLAALHAGRRKAGETRLREVLHALGHSYRATGGWHITAYATPDRTIGYVNITHGVAVATDQELDADVIEALTFPAQQAGPVASGAAFWTSPDAGEAHRAQAPAGWVQLLADLRDTEPPGKTVPAKGVHARIVAWCLMTCYDRLGDPGYMQLDGPFAWSGWQPSDPRSWPCAEETRQRMDQAGLAVLDAIARDLAAQAGIGEQIAAALDTEGPLWQKIRAARAALDATGDPRDRQALPRYTPAEEAARSALGIVTGDVRALHRALADARITELAHACGDDDEDTISEHKYHALIERLLRRVVTPRLLPAAEALAGQYEPDQYGQVRGLDSLLEPAAMSLATQALTGGTATGPVRPGGAAGDALKEMTRIYHEQGPVTVNIPLAVPGHLPWPDDDPVGIQEIADRLGVPRERADKWRQRGVLPVPEESTVGGRPWWRWRTISESAQNPYGLGKYLGSDEEP